MSLPNNHPQPQPSPSGPDSHPALPPPPERPVPPTWLSLGIRDNSATGGVADHDATAAPALRAPPAVPPFGSVSLPGSCREMEDTLTVMPSFYPHTSGGDEIGERLVISQQEEPQFHFFAVFDGHGESYVSALCKDHMHLLLANELANALGDANAHQTAALLPAASQPQQRSNFPDAGIWTAALRRCFARVDQLALASCTCGGVSGGGPCACDLQAGLRTYIAGSTAVVAVVGPDQIIVANCGDSRAVLGRAGNAFPLSVDHKPDRPDELARIEEAGGKVIHLNGAPRVMGILAMSRAIGDKYLKPAVTSEPEITITYRTPEDECLIIASDGLWDVLSNDIACNIVRNCLNDADMPQENGGSTFGEGGKEASVLASDERCTLAATLLTRMALGRMSCDDISVIVVDLRRTQN